MAALSYGAIKKHLKVGTSTQIDVIKLLGSPNNLTMTSNGNEVTSVKGEPLPPTPTPGSTYTLVDPTKNKSGR
jgi:hypothetical protein